MICDADRKKSQPSFAFTNLEMLPCGCATVAKDSSSFFSCKSSIYITSSFQWFLNGKSRAFYHQYKLYALEWWNFLDLDSPDFIRNGDNNLKVTQKYINDCAIRTNLTEPVQCNRSIKYCFMCTVIKWNHDYEWWMVYMKQMLDVADN